MSTSTEKIEVVDEANKKVTYSVIEGDLLKYYKNFRCHLGVSPKAEGGGSKLKWGCEFDKASEEVGNPNLIKDFAVKTFQELDAHSQKG